MKSLRAIVVVLAAALVAAPAALGKDGVRATLTTPIRLDAAPGTTLHVGWKLAARDGTPFGGGDVFVRLRSATGAPAETAYVNGGGTFAADVVVPKGGIGDVQIGIRGWSSGPDGTHEAPMMFPITNDPLPGPALATGGSNMRRNVRAVALAALAAVGALGLVVFRRLRNRRNPALQAGRALEPPSRTPGW